MCLKKIMTGKAIFNLAFGFGLLATGLSAADGDRAGVSFELAKPGRVSLAVYDADGRQVRTLLNAASQEKGRHVVPWDGLDRDGNPLPGGEYTWKLLSGPGLSSEWLLSLGTSVGQRFWPGQHVGVTAVAVRRDSLYALAGGSEGAPSVVKGALDGTVIWESGGLEPWEHTTDVAVDGGHVYVMYANSGNIYMLDERTGRRLGMADPETGAKKEPAKGRQAPPRQDKLQTLSLLKSLDFKTGSGSAPNGAVAVPLALYDKNRGCGWESIEKLEALGAEAGRTADYDAQGLNTSGPADPNAKAGESMWNFLVDMPEGKYKVRILWGTGRRAFPDSNVWAQGEWKTGTDVPAWTPKQKEPPSAISEFFAEVKADNHGQLKLGFRNKKGTPASWAVRGIEIYTFATQMDAARGELAVGFPDTGELKWLEPATGAELDSARIDGRMADVKIGGAGELLVLAGDKLLGLSRKQKTPAVRVAGLDEPVALALDPADGGVFIAERGQTQQVSKFDRQGKKIRSFGIKGGRKTGLYQAADFYRVWGLAADGRGGFVAAEADSAPRRVVHCGGDGTVLREWFGGQQFYTYAEADPGNPNRVWMDSQFDWLMEAEVDWTKRTWRPRACYRWNSNLPKRMFNRNKMAAAMHPFRADLDGDGQAELYLWSDLHRALLLQVDETAGQLWPVSALDFATNSKNGKPFPPEELAAPWREALERIGVSLADTAARNQYTSFSWADDNRNHVVDSSEVEPQVVKGPDGKMRGMYEEVVGTCRWLDDDFTVYQCRGYGMMGRPGFFRYPARDRAAGAFPRWDWTRQEAGFISPFATTVGLQRDAQGNLYQLGQGGGDGFVAADTYGVQAHGYAWPANQTDRAGLIKWSPKGVKLWESGLKAATKDSLPGQLQYPVRIAGLVKNQQFVGVADKIRQPCEFWTTDGLYVGGLFDRHAEDAAGERAYRWWRIDEKQGDEFENRALIQYDMMIGGSLTELPDGTVVFMGAGWNNCPAYRVTGWEQYARQEGRIQLAAAVPAARQGRGLRTEYFDNPDLTGTPVVRRLDAQVWHQSSAPGKNKPGITWPDECKGRPLSARWTGFIEPALSDQYSFLVYVGRDSKNIPEKVRLTIDGQVVVDAWDERPQWRSRLRSRPVALTAGRPVPIVLEYARTGPGDLHLSWESVNTGVTHVPTASLYPEKPAPASR